MSTMPHERTKWSADWDREDVTVADLLEFLEAAGTYDIGYGQSTCAAMRYAAKIVRLATFGLIPGMTQVVQVDERILTIEHSVEVEVLTSGQGNYRVSCPCGYDNTVATTDPEFANEIAMRHLSNPLGRCIHCGVDESYVAHHDRGLYNFHEFEAI